jgi:hypothetical protein
MSLAQPRTFTLLCVTIRQCAKQAQNNTGLSGNTSKRIRLACGETWTFVPIEPHRAGNNLAFGPPAAEDHVRERLEKAQVLKKWRSTDNHLKSK